MTPLDHLVADFRRRERDHTRALLRAERAALRGLRSHARDQVNRVIAAAAAVESHPDPARVRRHAHATVAAAATLVAGAVAHAAREARTNAREEARGVLRVHLGEHGIVVPDELPHEPEDDAMAEAAGASYAGAWSAAAAFAVGRWGRGREDSLAGALGKTLEATDGRLRRLAAGETALAFGGEHSRLSREAHAELEAWQKEPERHEPERRGPPEREDPNDRRGPPLAPPTPPGGMGGGGGPYRDAGGTPPPPGERLVKVWDAVLDARVCPNCRNMHGTVVLAAAEFPGGDPPRHPFCRCVPVVILTSLSLREIERALERDDFPKAA